MAGVPGFEPGNAEIKTRCLTTWRYPTCKFIRKTLNHYQSFNSKIMVREERLELSHLAAPEPKSGVSTNFTTPAFLSFTS